MTFGWCGEYAIAVTMRFGIERTFQMGPLLRFRIELENPLQRSAQDFARIGRMSRKSPNGSPGVEARFSLRAQKTFPKIVAVPDGQAIGSDVEPWLQKQIPVTRGAYRGAAVDDLKASASCFGIAS